MRTKYFFSCLLLMAASLLLTACSNDPIDSLDEGPETKTVLTRTIPYKVTVKKDELTRAKLADDQKTLQFAEGDRIFLYGGKAGGDYNLYGYLSVDNEGIGSSTSVTFSGDLTLEEGYSGAFDEQVETVNGVLLTAKLISKDCNIMGFDEEKKRYRYLPDPNGTIPFRISSTLYNTLEEAVSAESYMESPYYSSTSPQAIKYSSTGINNNITLVQNTGFLCFTITFEGGVSANKEVKMWVAGTFAANNSQTTMDPNGYVTTYEEDGKVKVKFVAAIYTGTSGTAPKYEPKVIMYGPRRNNNVPDSEYSSCKASFNTNMKKFMPAVYNIELTIPAPPRADLYF